MIKDDAYRLENIRRLGSELADYISESKITEATIESDRIVQWAVTTPLYNIGEHVYRLSDELKDAHPEIAWHRISGMRHRLVHDYEDTNWSIVASTIMKDLPGFLEALKDIVP